MAFTGKLETEEEIKSSAEKFWGAIKDNTDLLGKIFPEVFKSIQVAEGDGKSVGSIRHIKYAEVSLSATLAIKGIDVSPNSCDA
ncbi:hypothetical protein MRB53_017917 [Persea americana]|uniref:Uncharacterized protein n=1 Tax=Persea americana TaxID=3435 RepID=A0ACC2M752_PERAE|nr:hypothetical protein MRB53_017917 [Persea americana]